MKPTRCLLGGCGNDSLSNLTSLAGFHGALNWTVRCCSGVLSTSGPSSTTVELHGYSAISGVLLNTKQQTTGAEFTVLFLGMNLFTNDVNIGFSS